MTLRLDLNADVGEHDGPPPAEARALLRVITSANIACGAHAGDPVSMRHTIAEATSLGVQIGAHPSFPDREGFGRRVLLLPPREISDAVAQQLQTLAAIAESERSRLRHVKPHGALYNVAWRDGAVADAIVAGILAVDSTLALYAPPGSALAAAGRVAGLTVVAEGFADRAYEDDGRLTPRDQPGAVIEDVEEVGRRARAWVRTGEVASRTGKPLPLSIDTLCVHGDTPNAVGIATGVRNTVEAAGVILRPALES
jgi:UPF0271 protein